MANRSVLPRDLIVEILSRLPVKSLMRFKAVCRGWSALISRSSFISAHLGRSNRKSSLLLTFRGRYGAETHGISLLDEGEGDDDEVGMLKNQDLPFQANRKSDMLSIVGCCNGLVCVSLEKDGADCVLWNPATRQYRRFPAPLIPAVPNHCYVRWGFGFHPDTCDHMLLRIVQSFDGQKPPFCRDSSKYTIRTEIFTLSTGSWREISGIPPCIFNDYGVALVLKGVRHWIVNEGSGRSDGDFVLSFDMGTLQFSRMEVPPNRGVYEVKKLLEFQQMLAMLTLNVGSNSIYHMWTMKSGSWTKLFVYGPFPGPVLTVGVWRNCKLLVSTALMEEGDDITLHNSHLLLFDPIRKITREVSKDSVQSFYEGGTYVESLLSVYTGF